MADSLTYQRMGPAARGQVHTLFSQTMAYVAATAALFALGAWLGRDLTGGVGIVAFIAAFACLIGMRFAVRSSLQLTVGLLGAFGLLIGLAVAPTVATRTVSPLCATGREFGPVTDVMTGGAIVRIAGGSGTATMVGSGVYETIALAPTRPSAAMALT